MITNADERINMDDNGKELVRFAPEYNQGLTSAQAEQRAQEGLSNAYHNNKTKSYRKIFKDNLLTFFNILNAVLAGLVIATGYYKDLAFMIVIIANLAIGLFQEIASKRTLDKLSLLVAAKVIVIRNGQEIQINASELVLDDIMLLKSGNQISADGILQHGTLEVNESLISGESDVIVKHPGDFLYSGSYVVSGNAYAQVERVGEESFANQISSGMKVSQPHVSALKGSINKILRIVSFIVIPIGVLMFLRQGTIDDIGITGNILKTVAAMIGMIPEGLFLLTSMALATSAVILAYKQTLVQDLYCIETLARVDILCLDKTGTLTMGKMHVSDLVPIDADANYETILANLCGATQDDNSTITALRNKFGDAHDYPVAAVIPFSSARKYSGAVFSGHGTYLIGAFEFIFPNLQHPGLQKQSEAYSRAGNRVLVLAHSPAAPVEGQLPEGLEPLAFILITDILRPEAAAALQYFYDQDVDIKIISGDNAKTVMEVSKKAGVRHADRYIDASTLHTDEEIAAAMHQYTVFGRVTPDQKKKMILALKQEGHTVAMTGDGVNDVLALKEADCSVAMASGSDAAKNISTLVLLDSNFAHMPDIVAEGRKVVNNIQRVATLFITKTVYAILLALSTLLLLSSGYPFSPLQLTLISFVTIGFPAFFLALEPNNTRVKGNFLVNVFAKSLPGGICVILSILLVNFLSGFFGYSASVISTMCIMLATAAGLWVVLKVSRPFTIGRKIIFAATVGIFVLCITVLRGFFDIAALTPDEWLVLAIIIAAMPFLMKGIEWCVKRLFAHLHQKNRLQKMTDRLNDFAEKK